MRYYRSVLLFAFLILVLWTSTQSVLGIKLLELQLYIEKDVLQNFELSSQLLELQFHRSFSDQNDFQSEIEQHVLAVSILNEPETEMADISLLNQAGIGIVNSVRMLSFRPLLDFWRERKLLLILKYAFYLERSRRFTLAVKEYENFIHNTLNASGSGLAFALLHQGYCQALLGNIKPALENISVVIENFPGSHYSRTASVLHRLLSQRAAHSKNVEAEHAQPAERAHAYFQLGNFQAAKQIYESISRLTLPMDMYRYARLKEELGKMKEAVEDYKRVIGQKNKTQAARLSNRRLLLIGGLYGGSRELRRYAKNKALEMDDIHLLNTIELTIARLPKNAVTKESLKIKKIKEEFLSVETDPVEDKAVRSKKIGDPRIVTGRQDMNTESAKTTADEMIYRGLFLMPADQEGIASGRITVIPPADSSPKSNKTSRTKEYQSNLLSRLVSIPGLAVSDVRVGPPQAPKKSNAQTENASADPLSSPKPVLKQRKEVPPPLNSVTGKQLLVQKESGLYLIVTTKDGRRLWGEQITYAYGYIKVHFHQTAFLISPKQMSRVQAVRLRGTARTSNRRLLIKYNDGESLILPAFSARGKDGFDHKGGVIPFKDIDSITPRVL